MPSTILLKALGLSTSPNQLANESGSLDEAINVVIRRDNVIEPRRGFKLYGDLFGTSTDTASQLLSYQHSLIKHYNTTLSYDSDAEGTWVDFDGDFSPAATGRRLRSIEANGNFFFTTSQGVKKISAKSSDEFSSDAGYIADAGGVKAIDIQTRLNIEPGVQTSWFTQDSTVGYRVAWGIKDKNDNLILGTPSQYNQIYNELLPLVVYDFNRTLGTLDDIANGVSADTNASGTCIDNENYMTTYKMTSDDSATTLRTNLIGLATKIDNDIIYANSSGTNAQLTISSCSIASTTCTVNFSAGTATNFWSSGSKVYLSGFTGTGSTFVNGSQSLTGVSASSITFTVAGTGSVSVSGSQINSNEYRSLTDSTGALFSAVTVPDVPPTNGELTYFQDYLDAIMTQLQNEPSAVISASLQTNFISLLDLTSTATVLLDIGIPQDVTANHFLQIYRSEVATATSTEVLTETVFPNDELQLVYEAFPTTAELAAGVMTVEDITLSFFRGANLYTNPDSGEGPTQANDVPPACLDLNVFKNTTFYANTRTRHRLGLNLLGVSNMISDYDNGTTPKVVSSNTDSANTYSFVTGRAQSSSVICVGDSSNSLSGKYFLINNANDHTGYYVWYKTSGAVAADPAVSGRTGIEVYIATGETASNVARKTANTLSRYIFDFVASSSSTTCSVTNVDDGYTTASSAGTSGFTVSTTVSGRGERYTRETTQCIFPAGSGFAASGTANYFKIYPPFERPPYYVWFKVGTSTDPAVTGYTGIEVDITIADTAAQVASSVSTAVGALTDVFSTSINSSTVTITNVDFGPATDTVASSMPGGYSASVTQQGALEVLLSGNESAAIAVDETARSFVRVINRNQGESNYAYYLSTVQGVPGQMTIEARELDENTFYALGNNSNTGQSFSPDISPTLTVTANTQATTTIVTAAGHGMGTGDDVVIVNSNSIPNIDGVYEITYLSASTFSINVNVVTAGTTGSAIPATDGQFSNNEVKSNRIYYSKSQQPEAVPILNYFDVGAVNRAILRIFPLRDSLFVFKEDGLWRISGEIAPYNISLFDSSYIILAPDSLDVCNNVLYSWTTQGINSVTEGGAEVVSRKIDQDLLRLQSSTFNSDFASITWGIGYESDNSYTVYCASSSDDTVATLAYRYGVLTKSWSTVDKTATCGIINPADDRMYLGAGDTDYIEQERKSFERTDYADREWDFDLTTGNLINSDLDIVLSNVENIYNGDVLAQVQHLTIYEFNALLQKLDDDPNIVDTDYYSTQISSPGDDLQLKMYDPSAGTGLAVKLDADSGIVTHNYVTTVSAKTCTILSNSAPAAATIITTSAAHGLVDGRIVTISGVTGSVPSIDGTHQITLLSPTTFSIPVEVNTAGTGGSLITVESDFRDIRACFAAICANLNDDTGTGFKNYRSSETTSLQETVITNVNRATRTITVSQVLPWIVGPLIVYNAIPTTFTYSANSMTADSGSAVTAPQGVGDPLQYKHIREATMIFESQTFTTATMSFATDLVPSFVDVEITGSGSGIFGFTSFGNNLFGGIGAFVPFRTYIPRNCQRCRFIYVKFSHRIAREKYSIYGTTLTGEVAISTRAYR
jgi:hypothetical protein